MREETAAPQDRGDESLRHVPSSCRSGYAFPPGEVPLGTEAVDPGCAYILDDRGPGLRRTCALPRRPGSSYCAWHHAVCHLACGSAAEARRLRAVEKLAAAVGGRRGRGDAGPSARFLARLEWLVRALS